MLSDPAAQAPEPDPAAVVWAQCEHAGCGKWRKLPLGAVVDEDKPWWGRMGVGDGLAAGAGGGGVMRLRDGGGARAVGGGGLTFPPYSAPSRPP